MRASVCIAATAASVACTAADEGAESRYSPLASEVVRDTQTGLLWTANDTGRELSWPEADAQCRSLARGTGNLPWRLPSIEELTTLYDTSLEQPCGETAICRIDPAIDLSSPYQWSATAPARERRFYYDFSHGSRLSPLIRPSLTRGTLCTRG